MRDSKKNQSEWKRKGKYVCSEVFLGQGDGIIKTSAVLICQ